MNNNGTQQVINIGAYITFPNVAETLQLQGFLVQGVSQSAGDPSREYVVVGYEHGLRDKAVFAFARADKLVCGGGRRGEPFHTQITYLTGNNLNGIHVRLVDKPGVVGDDVARAASDMFLRRDIVLTAPSTKAVAVARIYVHPTATGCDVDAHGRNIKHGYAVVGVGGAPKPGRANVEQMRYRFSMTVAPSVTG